MFRQQYRDFPSTAETKSSWAESCSAIHWKLYIYMNKYKAYPSLILVEMQAEDVTIFIWANQRKPCNQFCPTWHIAWRLEDPHLEFPHLWQRALNTSKCRAHSPELSCWRSRKSACQFSKPEMCQNMQLCPRQYYEPEWIFVQLTVYLFLPNTLMLKWIKGFSRNLRDCIWDWRERHLTYGKNTSNWPLSRTRSPSWIFGCLVPN